MKKIAILQSNYTWKGYFDMIAAVDEFILYDDMQYTRRDWRNRNQIKTPQGQQWLPVPVKVKGRYFQTIRETKIDETDWATTHWNMLVQNYKKAPHFEEIAAIFQPLYQRQYTHLSPLSRDFIEATCTYLGITTKISSSWDYQLVEGKTERLLDLCVQAGGSEYISGSSAKGYVEEHFFIERSITLSWLDHIEYPWYTQCCVEYTTGCRQQRVINYDKNEPDHMRSVH